MGQDDYLDIARTKIQDPENEAALEESKRDEQTGSWMNVLQLDAYLDHVIDPDEQGP